MTSNLLFLLILRDLLERFLVDYIQGQQEGKDIVPLMMEKDYRPKGCAQQLPC